MHGHTKITDCQHVTVKEQTDHRIRDIRRSNNGAIVMSKRYSKKLYKNGLKVSRIKFSFLMEL